MKPVFNKTMEIKESTGNVEYSETPDNWWYRIYLAVIISNIIIIFALWSFTKIYSH